MSRSKYRISKSVLVIILFLLSISTTSINARILSGSISERKMAKTIGKLLKSARRNWNKQKIKDAIDDYWKILEINPRTIDAYIELGLIYVDLKIYDRVVELLEPGLELARGQRPAAEVSDLYCILTQSYLELGFQGKATKALIKAAQLNPKSPQPRKILGDIYLNSGRIKQAIKAYKKALNLDPFFQPAADKLQKLSQDYPAYINMGSKKTVKKQQKNTIKPIQKQNYKVAKRTNKAKQARKQYQILPIPAKAVSANKPIRNKNTATNRIPRKSTYKTKPTTIIGARPLPSKKLSEVANEKIIIPQSIPTKASAVPESNTKSIDEAIDKLLAGDYKEKANATTYLMEKNKKGINAIEDLLYDSDPDVRLVAIAAFGSFIKHKRAVYIILEDAMDDPDPVVRKAVKRALQDLRK